MQSIRNAATQNTSQCAAVDGAQRFGLMLRTLRTNAEGCRAKGRSSALHSSIGSMRVCEPPTALQVGCTMRMRAYTLMSACSYSATQADSRACRTLLYCCYIVARRALRVRSWLYDEPLVDSLAALVGSRHSIHL